LLLQYENATSYLTAVTDRQSRQKLPLQGSNL
jgi:hypothetical protein